ncbi:MAG: hemolysin III family protein [Planctomycetota bacterium]
MAGKFESLPLSVLQRSNDEELANTITHGIGLALSIIGLVVLHQVAPVRGDRWLLLGNSVYGLTLVCLYAASTLYHALQGERIKRSLRTADQVCIYLLIAGTYTPFILSYLHGAWGTTMMFLVWMLAAAGIIYRVAFATRFPHISALPYILLGWLAVFFAKPILESFPLEVLAWIAAGGIFYTAGVYFYAREHIRFSHAIWHVFVMAGSLCHYLAVLFYVIPSIT